MPIIKNVKLRYAHLRADRPNPRFDKKNPRWEIQVYTNDPEERERLRQQGLLLRLVKHPEGHANEGEPVLNEKGEKEWKLTLSKRSLSKEGKPNHPVEVITGAKQPLDPGTIGNGSVGNVRYTTREVPDGDKVKVYITLQGVQITHHIVYESNREDFDTDEYTTAERTATSQSSEDSGSDGDYDGDGDDNHTASKTNSTPNAPKGTPSAPANTNRSSADY